MAGSTEVRRYTAHCRGELTMEQSDPSSSPPPTTVAWLSVRAIWPRSPPSLPLAGAVPQPYVLARLSPVGSVSLLAQLTFFASPQSLLACVPIPQVRALSPPRPSH